MTSRRSKHPETAHLSREERSRLGRFARWRHAVSGEPTCPVGEHSGKQRFAVVEPDTINPPVPPA